MQCVECNIFPGQMNFSLEINFFNSFFIFKRIFGLFGRYRNASTCILFGICFSFRIRCVSFFCAGNGKRSEGSMVPSQLDSRSGYERFRHMIPSETSDESNKIEDIEPDTTYNQKSLIELLRPLLRNTEARIKANNFMRKIVSIKLLPGEILQTFTGTYNYCYDCVLRHRKSGG